MKKTFSASLLILSSLALSVAFIISCNKKNDAASKQVQLLSFGPTGAKHGDTARFVGYNLDRVTAINFVNATVQQSAFTMQNNEEIRLVIPQQAEQGYVTLKTPDGDIVTKTRFNLEVPVVITSITGQVRPGENITIKGQYLNWVNRVTFPRDKIVDTFVSRTLTELVVKVPADAQTGKLLIYTGGTEPLQIETDSLKVVLPAGTAITPNPVKHAANITITGTNLDLTKGVIFSGVAAPVTTFVTKTPTQLVVKVPAGTTKGKVILLAYSDVQVETGIEVATILPTVTAISPNPIDSVSNLTITGTNLDLVTGVTFTGVANAVTTFVSQSATQLVVKTPSKALKGKLVLSVANSSVTVESTQILNFNGALPPLNDFTMPIYTDALQNGFQDWSYTAEHNFSSTANVRQGTTSIKATYGGGGYEGITFHHNTGISTAGYTKLEFSVFGEAGTGGKKLSMVINGNYTNPPQVTIIEGEWSTFIVNLSSFGSPDPLKEIVLQSAGWTGIIHIDHVGLR